MLFGKLFLPRSAIGDLDVTVRFYTEVLGMVVSRHARPAFKGVAQSWRSPTASRRSTSRQRRRARR